VNREETHNGCQGRAGQPSTWETMDRHLCDHRRWIWLIRRRSAVVPVG
jgi:hypothetical protein